MFSSQAVFFHEGSELTGYDQASSDAEEDASPRDTFVVLSKRGCDNQKTLLFIGLDFSSEVQERNLSFFNVSLVRTVPPNCLLSLFYLPAIV